MDFVIVDRIPQVCEVMTVEAGIGIDIVVEVTKTKSWVVEMRGVRVKYETIEERSQFALWSASILKNGGLRSTYKSFS